MSMIIILQVHNTRTFASMLLWIYEIFEPLSKMNGRLSCKLLNYALFTMYTYFKCTIHSLARIYMINKRKMRAVLQNEVPFLQKIIIRSDFVSIT